MILSKSRFIYLIIAILIVVTALSSGQAHAQKKKKSETAGAAAFQSGSPQPDATPTPPPPRPANGSLFTDYAPGQGLFGDFTASRVGDLVFVDVTETSAASVSSGAKRSRDSGTIGGLVGALGALPGPSAAVGATVMGGLGQRKFEGNGSTQRESTLSARITARVVEVFPNGDLRIVAEKMVKINKEEERLTLSGIIRTSDLSSGNAIPTTAIGDLQVALNGKGIASADNAPGWLFRLFEKILPF
jgi:flagellar L-ring protein precursor FlgH